MLKLTNDTEKSIPSRKNEPLNTITKPVAKLPWKMLPTKIISSKQGHSGSIFPPHDSDSPCKKTGLEINTSIVVGELKENIQGSPTLPSQNDTNDTDNGNRAPINKTGVNKGDSLQFKQPNQSSQRPNQHITIYCTVDRIVKRIILRELTLDTSENIRRTCNIMIVVSTR